EGEDDQIGVDGADAPEARPGQAQVEFGPYQLGCDYDAHRHAQDAPEEGHQGELTHHTVVVSGLEIFNRMHDQEPEHRRRESPVSRPAVVATTVFPREADGLADRGM